MSQNVIALDSRRLGRRIDNAFNAARILQRQPDNSWSTVWSIPLGDLMAARGPDEAVYLIEGAIARAKLPATQEWMLSIPPLGSNGFGIDVMQGDGCVRAWFGGLEEEFDTLAIALAWVRRAMSGDYELAESKVGDRPAQWRLGPAGKANLGRGDGAAVLASGHSLFGWPFGARATVVRRNAPAWR